MVLSRVGMPNSKKGRMLSIFFMGCWFSNLLSSESLGAWLALYVTLDFRNNSWVWLDFYLHGFWDFLGDCTQWSLLTRPVNKLRRLCPSPSSGAHLTNVTTVRCLSAFRWGTVSGPRKTFFYYYYLFISNHKSTFLWANMLTLEPFAPFSVAKRGPFPMGGTSIFLLYFWIVMTM
jgi:hypothetical protein